MSIVEVARIAGLSHSTVSRVINGRPGVAPETVEAVQRAMQAVGYTPSARRPGPKPVDRNGVTTGSVGLLMIGTEAMFARAPVTAAVFHAVEQALAEKGFNLIVGQVDDAGRLPPTVARGQIDGLLLHGYAPPASIRRRLERHPSVWLLSPRSARGYWGDRVCPDNELIGRLAAEHLVATRGHRSLGYLFFSPTHAGFRQRAEAFVDTAEELGATARLVPDDVQNRGPTRREEHDERETERILDMLIEDGPLPDAIFVPRDRLTPKVYRGLRRRGIEPGRDIEVMSCDNEPILEALDPRPATIDVQPRLIGRQAVEQLALRMAARDRAVRATVTVEPRLVPAESFEDDGFGADVGVEMVHVRNGRAATRSGRPGSSGSNGHGTVEDRAAPA